MRRVVLLVLALAVAAGGPTAAAAQAPKRGGVLTTMIVEDPPGFSIHESATVSTVWPMKPCYSNLVIFDQRSASSGTIVSTVS